MLQYFILLFILVGILTPINADQLIERPIENRNLYLPFLLFMEPYPTTPTVLGKGKFSIDSGIAISNMIDNNNVHSDSVSGYSKYKPFYWQSYSESFLDGRLTPYSYYASDLLTYNRLEQQSHLRLDAEIERFHTKISYGLFDNLEIGFEITSLSYNTGIFDKPITGYHRAVGIPYPLRDIYPDDKFAFQISDNRKFIINGKPGTSTGDSILDSKWQILKQRGIIPALAIINSLKIPTGNKSLFMGSGKLDFATGISSKWNFYRFFHFLNLFGVIPSDPFNSSEIKIRPFATASSTLGYSFTNSFSLVMQSEIKGSPYHSGIKIINQPAILLSFGLNWKIFSECVFRFNFTEDPITRSVPDVSGQGSVFCIRD